MAFMVEDGTGVADANSYNTVSGVGIYHLDRGHDSWETFTTAQKQTACVRAADYIDKRFGRRFRGYRQSSSQGMEWPRLNAYDDDDYALSGVPKQLAHAHAEYALRAALSGELAPDPPKPVQDQDLSSTTAQSGNIVTGQIKRITEKAPGPLEETKEYATAAESASRKLNTSSLVAGYNIPEYPAADMLIEELLTPTGVTKAVRGG